MAVINVDDIYTLDNTGKQVDDAVDYALANSNRNLLDNPWFTVNQRNVAVGTNINGNGFVADRWQATGTTGATRNSDGTLTITDTLFHKLQPALKLDGKTVTLSVLYADGTIEANTFPWSGTGTKYFTYGRAVVYASAYQINFNSFTKNVKAFKLELGSYSTLANDVPPDYWEELRKCRHYFYRVSGSTYAVMGMAVSATQIEFSFPFTMRQAPSIAMNGTIQALGQGGLLTLISVASTGQTTTNVRARFNVSGATAYTAYLMNLGGYIDFSADL